MNSHIINLTGDNLNVIEVLDSDEESENDQRTIFCGNLNENVTEEILYELFLQGGPVEAVTIPTDNSRLPKRYAFIRFIHKSSIPYCLKLFRNVKLFGQRIYLSTRQRKIPPLLSPTVPSVIHQFPFLTYDNMNINNRIRTAAHFPPSPLLPDFYNTGYLSRLANLNNMYFYCMPTNE